MSELPRSVVKSLFGCFSWYLGFTGIYFAVQTVETPGDNVRNYLLADILIQDCIMFLSNRDVYEKKRLEIRRETSVVTSCAINIIRSIPGHWINSINFLGAKHRFDSEAEFRLVQLGSSIVEAKRVSLEVSMSLKASYAKSIQNSESRHEHLTQVLTHATDAKEAWANVAKDFRDTRRWLDGKLREDYSRAFVQAATVGSLHTALTEQGMSNVYMAFAFENVRSICDDNVPPSQSVLACFELLAGQAERCVNQVAQFILYLEELRRQENFSLYRYIFHHLALNATKPRLFELDEAYFASQNEFEITYEAVEQIARHAHTMVPGTHSQEITFFDLEFTE